MHLYSHRLCQCWAKDGCTYRDYQNCANQCTPPVYHIRPMMTAKAGAMEPTQNVKKQTKLKGGIPEADNKAQGAKIKYAVSYFVHSYLI